MAPTLCEGRYRILSVLGEGGMSTVYAAHDERLGVQRAVKILSPALVHHSSLRKRFEAEARTTARLRHPNIVTVHDVGTDSGRTYMVLELMTGGSLMSRVEELGPLPPRMATEVVLSVLSALQYAHERGVVHRDVKPHNVLVDQEGKPKLTDFGIARVLSSDEGLTRTGAAIGTPAYMAPEQRGNASQVDGRADIFSSGATLYTLLTGKEPFDIYAAELQERLFADIPPPLREVIRRATRYAVHDRYATGNAMIADLKAALEQLPPDPEGTPALGTPLSGRVRPARGRDHTPAEQVSPITFDDALEDAPRERPNPTLSAFPSLAGVETREPAKSGTDIEHSLNTREIVPPSRLATLRSLAWLIALALAASTVIGLLLWRFGRGHGPTPATTAHAQTTPAPAEATTTPEVSPPATTSAHGDTGQSTASSPTISPTNTNAATSPTSVPRQASTSPVAGALATRTSTPTPTTTTTTTRPTTTTTTTTTSSHATGVLTITTKPRAADVFLDDSYQGRTRWRAELAPRAWHVLLESEEGGRHEAELTVLPGQETRYCWDFKAEAICAR